MAVVEYYIMVGRDFHSDFAVYFIFSSILVTVGSGWIFFQFFEDISHKAVFGVRVRMDFHQILWFI